MAFVLQEWDSPRAELVVIGETVIFDRDSASAPQDISERFANRLEALVTPGRRYRVALVAASETHHQGFFVHFGPPATGRGVWHDSIKVCIDAPEDPSAPILARLDALELADLEGRLYERQCLPRVWMPEAQGGQLARARDLVQLRLNQATATGDTGVNARVAAARLVSADASIVAGQYQRACRELSDGLRALTTP